jgi:hypothetical protein
MSAEPNEKAWKCAGCGVPSPDRIRACNCPTAVLWQEGAGTVTKAGGRGLIARVMGSITLGKDSA